MTSDLQELTNELMLDTEFRKEYEALQPERDITMSLIQARKEAGLTQAELSKKTGISQADISRLENGTRNPSLALLNRIAEAVDATLRIEFIPNKKVVR
jgi:transcriptional regulator with XRE-family HTH domain